MLLLCYNVIPTPVFIATRFRNVLIGFVKDLLVVIFYSRYVFCLDHNPNKRRRTDANLYSLALGDIFPAVHYVIFIVIPFKKD